MADPDNVRKQQPCREKTTHFEFRDCSGASLFTFDCEADTTRCMLKPGRKSLSLWNTTRQLARENSSLIEQNASLKLSIISQPPLPSTARRAGGLRLMDAIPRLYPSLSNSKVVRKCA